MSQQQPASTILNNVKIPRGIDQHDVRNTNTTRSWNAQQLGLRLGADAASAATASLLVAPVITIIDQYVYIHALVSPRN